jgi:hypothetical protein
MKSQTAARSGCAPPGRASCSRRALRGAERLGAGDAVGVEQERGGPAGDEAGDGAQRVGLGERGPQFGVDDRVDRARFAASAVADGALAVEIGPARAVGEDVALVRGHQMAHDRLERLQLLAGRLEQAGAQIVAEPEVAAHGLGAAGTRVRAPVAVLGGGGREVGRLQAGAGEVALVARGRCLVGLGGVEPLADHVEHEDGVDHPDAGGEVAAALMHVGVAADAGTVAQRGVDPDAHRAAAGAHGERVQARVELVVGAAEQAGGLAAAGGGQVRSCVRELGVGLEQGALVDPDGVGGVVLDDRAVHEGAHVAQRGVVQVGRRDALRDRLGELRRELVHVGEPVGEGDRDLLAGGTLGARARIGSGSVSWWRRLWALVAPMPRSAHTAAIRSASRSPVRAAQQSANWACWSVCVSSSRWFSWAWIRRTSSADGSWSSSSTIRLAIGALPSAASVWLAPAASSLRWPA